MVVLVVRGFCSCSYSGILTPLSLWFHQHLGYDHGLYSEEEDREKGGVTAISWKPLRFPWTRICYPWPCLIAKEVENGVWLCAQIDKESLDSDKQIEFWTTGIELVRISLGHCERANVLWTGKRISLTHESGVQLPRSSKVVPQTPGPHTPSALPFLQPSMCPHGAKWLLEHQTPHSPQPFCSHVTVQNFSHISILPH